MEVEFSVLSNKKYVPHHFLIETEQRKHWEVTLKRTRSNAIGDNIINEANMTLDIIDETVASQFVVGKTVNLSFSTIIR